MASPMPINKEYRPEDPSFFFRRDDDSLVEAHAPEPGILSVDPLLLLWLDWRNSVESVLSVKESSFFVVFVSPEFAPYEVKLCSLIIVCC